jgi:hypothetical protein
MSGKVATVGQKSPLVKKVAKKETVLMPICFIVVIF